MNNNLDNDGSHVFIIRLWREQGRNTDEAPEWRSLIEDVSSGNRFPIRDMSALYALLAPFGDEMGLNDFLASEEAQD